METNSGGEMPGGEAGGQDAGGQEPGPVAIPSVADIVGASKQEQEQAEENAEINPDDKLESRLQTLARLESGVREKEAGWKSQVEEWQNKYKDLEDKYNNHEKSTQEFHEKLKNNPNALFDKYGEYVTFDQLVQRNLEGEEYEPKENPQITSLKKEIQELKDRTAKEKKEIEERQEIERQEAQKKAYQEFQQSVANEASTGNYPYVQATPGAVDLVWGVIEATFNESEGKTILEPKEAAGKVEKYLTDHYQKKGFVLNKPGQEKEPETRPGNSEPGSDYRRMASTLTSDHASPGNTRTPDAVKRRYDDDDDAMSRAIQRLKYT